jgi:hypothetical protein
MRKWTDNRAELCFQRDCGMYKAAEQEGKARLQLRSESSHSALSAALLAGGMEGQLLLGSTADYGSGLSTIAASAYNSIGNGAEPNALPKPADAKRLASTAEEKANAGKKMMEAYEAALSEKLGLTYRKGGTGTARTGVSSRADGSALVTQASMSKALAVGMQVKLTHKIRIIIKNIIELFYRSPRARWQMLVPFTGTTQHTNSLLRP